MGETGNHSTRGIEDGCASLSSAFKDRKRQNRDVFMYLNLVIGIVVFRLARTHSVVVVNYVEAPPICLHATKAGCLLFQTKGSLLERRRAVHQPFAAERSLEALLEKESIHGFMVETFWPPIVRPLKDSFEERIDTDPPTCVELEVLLFRGMRSPLLHPLVGPGRVAFQCVEREEGRVVVVGVPRNKIRIHTHVPKRLRNRAFFLH